jgi:hypothetical protein
VSITTEEQFRNSLWISLIIILNNFQKTKSPNKRAFAIFNNKYYLFLFLADFLKSDLGPTLDIAHLNPM